MSESEYKMRILAFFATVCSVLAQSGTTSCCDPSTPSCQTAIRYCMNNTAGGAITPSYCQTLACKTTSPSPSVNPRQPPPPSPSANPSSSSSPSAYPSYSGQPSASVYSPRATGTPTETGSGVGTASGTASGTATASWTAASSPSTTLRPSPASTIAATATPTPTGQGTSMQTYSLTFANSDPSAAVRPDRLAYLVNAIACSARVPIELVYISYIRANGAIVNFLQPTKNATGIPTNCGSPLRLRGRQLQIVATPSMTVAVYYLSPAPARSTDTVFQSYTAAIQGSTAATPINAPSGSGNLSDSSAAIYPERLNLSAGGVVGIVVGIAAAAVLAGGLYAVYLNRRRKPISRSSSVSTETRWSNLPGKTVYPPEARRH